MPLETTPLRPLHNAETGLSPERIQMIRDTISGDPKVGGLIRRIVLFGSRAKGTWREGSDIDLAIIVALDEKPIHTRQSCAGTAVHTSPSVPT